MNYPPGFAQGQHDRIFADADQSRGRNRQDCALCGRSFIQDSFDRVWYWSDDIDDYGFENLSYSKAIDPFETEQGWICSTACFNDNFALNEDESIPPRPAMPFLVKGMAS